jgi:hypothetical protein
MVDFHISRIDRSGPRHAFESIASGILAPLVEPPRRHCSSTRRQSIAQSHPMPRSRQRQHEPPGGNTEHWSAQPTLPAARGVHAETAGQQTYLLLILRSIAANGGSGPLCPPQGYRGADRDEATNGIRDERGPGRSRIANMRTDRSGSARTIRSKKAGTLA